MSTAQGALEKCVLYTNKQPVHCRRKFEFEITLPTIFHLRVLDNNAFNIFHQEKGARLPYWDSSQWLFHSSPQALRLKPALTSAKSDHHVEGSLIKLHVGSHKPGTEPIGDGR